ncbi:alcohol dehydrogenase GroES domain-containing protein [Roridomyces roridus]|uniref:Alcohol dehydrogenase GroES domain-containing protein n=1 Tax=Roridomyces roridus TaxID=1738132 RepID=A0AAD7B2T4_9AGAR|nr:alcohol dehydrogenase GroES domain-containing protein [Roridomyces roridus]
MSTMKALVFSAPGRPTLEERPRPTIQAATDAIVQMVKSSICGTDLHILKGDVPSVRRDIILGHEGTGIIYALGANVTRFKLNDRVVISGITSCRSCDFCTRDIPSHCVDGGWLIGNTIDGTQAEYIRIPLADGSLYHMVEGASEEAQVLCSDVMPTAFECGVISGRVKPGGTVAIVGGGPVGLAIAIAAQLYSPLKLIMITRDPNRLEKAKELGATHCIPFGPNAIKQVMELTNGHGVDTVVEAAGVPGTFDLCQEIVAVGGTIANVGVHGCKVDLNLDKLWHRNIVIATSLVDTTSTRMLLQLMDSGKIKPDILFTHRFRFADVLDAYATFGDATKHNALKVVLEF